MRAAIQARSPGATPALTTTGGTSDARFIKDLCPVVEVGLRNATAHQVDEHVALADLADADADLPPLHRGAILRPRRRQSHRQPHRGCALPHRRIAAALAVYASAARVAIVLLLGFSAGLPLALSAETLRVWMADRGVDVGTIGLICAGEPALHHQVPVGADRRCAAGAVAVGAARAAARLARGHAARH